MADATKLAAVPEGHEVFEQDGELLARDPSSGRTYLAESEQAHSGLVERVREHVEGVDPMAGASSGDADLSIVRSDGEARALTGDSSSSLADVIGASGKAKRPAEDKAMSGPSESKFASPAAEELASISGVDLSNVEGSGTDGKLTKADVEAAIAREG